MLHSYKLDQRKKKILYIVILLIAILIVSIGWFMIDRKKYDAYNQYNTDNKDTGEVMHYSKESDKLYVSLFYPKTESKKLNTIINDYYKEYLDNQKASKNSKDIIYMDYSIDKVFDQYLNLSFTAQRYNEDNEKTDTETKRFAYDLNKEKILSVNDCLRRSYKRTLSNINGIDKIEPEHIDLRIGKKKLTIYNDNEEKIEIDYGQNKELIRLANKNIPSDAPLDIKEPAAQPKVDPNKKMIAITLDDGPHKSNTLRTVELFEKYDGRATFLMLGKNVKQYPEIVKTVYEQGFEIGSHSWDHPDLRKLDANGIEKQIADTQNEIFKITGYEPEIIRPPYGAVNETAKQVIANNGMKIALWNVDTEDWKVKNAQKIKETIVNKAFDGAVILIHDIHTFTIDGLEMALEELSRNGYQFVTLETLSQYKELKNVIK